MKKEVSKYYSDVLKYYGFALSIPMGGSILQSMRGNHSSTEFLVSFGIFLFAIILIVVGGRISEYD